MAFQFPTSVRKSVYAAIAILIAAFDVLTVRDILNGKTDTAEGLIMLLGSLVILFLLYRKLSNAHKD